MDLDDIREILYAYTNHLRDLVENGNVEDLYEQDLVEEHVEEFLGKNDELTGHLEDPRAEDEESY